MIMDIIIVIISIVLLLPLFFFFFLLLLVVIFVFFYILLLLLLLLPLPFLILGAGHRERLREHAGPLRAGPGGRQGRAAEAHDAGALGQEGVADEVGNPNPNPRNLVNWCF